MSINIQDMGGEQRVSNNKPRNSSIELLKVIALFFVVLCHSIPLNKYAGVTELEGYINLGQSTNNIQTLILIVFSHLGQVGNALFIVPSVYFLIDSDRVKKGKILQFITDTFIVSIIYMFFSLIIMGKLPVAYFIRSLFPTTFNFYWFITCYILLYAIHPWLNWIIKKLDKYQLFSACFCMFLMYCVVSYILNGKYYYTHLVSFIVYYFIVGYAKLHLPALSKNKQQNIRILLSCICGFLGLIVVANYVGIRISAAVGLVGVLEKFVNPLIVGIAISAFNLCNLKKSNNKVVNMISSTSLLVFVISNNFIVCNYAKPLLFEAIYLTFTYHFIAPICIVIASITLVISVILAIIYMNTIRKGVVKISEYGVSICGLFTSKIFAFVDKIEKQMEENIKESDNY